MLENTDIQHQSSFKFVEYL